MVTVDARSRTIRRAPRSAPPVVPDSPITLSAPPRLDSQSGGAVAWLQYVFPIVGSLGGMLFIVNNPKPLFLASGLLFMLGSVGMGIGMGMQQRSSVKRRLRGGGAPPPGSFAGGPGPPPGAPRPPRGPHAVGPS